MSDKAFTFSHAGEQISQTLKRSKWSQPDRFNLENKKDKTRLQALITSGDTVDIHDQVQLIAEDLYDLAHPEQKDSKDPNTYADFIANITAQGMEYGEWFFFPWSRALVRYPEREDLRRIRTSRNRNLITSSEQERLYEATVAVFGLSVGSNVVEALLSSGIGGKLIIADMDTIEPSNLNRIRADFTQVGVKKLDYVAKRISMIDPYIEQVHLPAGLTAENLETVVTNHRPDVIIDEVDNLPIKIQLRKVAQKEGLPIVMATDDGDNALLDIERYDLESIEPFNGRIPAEIIDSVISGEFPREKLGLVIGKYFVGVENIPLRMFQSLQEVGKTLPSWPQLGNAAATGGTAAAFATRQIILDRNLPTQRVMVDFDKLMNSEIHTKEYRRDLAMYRAMLEDIPVVS
ncbi:MAG: ThiF family adenylyltransferase [Candidatus Saccharimonadales bacterium]